MFNLNIFIDINDLYLLKSKISTRINNREKEYTQLNISTSHRGVGRVREKKNCAKLIQGEKEAT